MNIVPIAFAFDENLILPAEVAICSLLQHAKETTYYQIYVLHGSDTDLSGFEADTIKKNYPHCDIVFKNVGDAFQAAFEIRDITIPAYYRLLIPEIIREHDKILYSDVDVIFRADLSAFYNNIELDDAYVAGVDSLAQFDKDTRLYYEKNLGISAKGVIYSGNLIINSKKMREDGIVHRFMEHAQKQYRFQDMDIINLVCAEHIKYLEPSFCVTTYFTDYALHQRKALNAFWTEREINEALQNGIVHYNGQKPWKGYCVNFDIWWEYYRKSPFFDAKFYFDFFYSRLNEYDLLPLWKRIKILIRYFVYGRKSM